MQQKDLWLGVQSLDQTADGNLNDTYLERDIQEIRQLLDEDQTIDEVS